MLKVYLKVVTREMSLQKSKPQPEDWYLVVDETGMEHGYIPLNHPNPGREAQSRVGEYICLCADVAIREEKRPMHNWSNFIPERV